MRKLKSKPSKTKSTKMKKKSLIKTKPKTCKRGHSAWHQESFGCDYIMDVKMTEGGIRAVMCFKLPLGEEEK